MQPGIEMRRQLATVTTADLTAMPVHDLLPGEHCDWVLNLNRRQFH
jgi:hypothetical protein